MDIQRFVYHPDNWGEFRLSKKTYRLSLRVKRRFSMLDSRYEPLSHVRVASTASISLPDTSMLS
jgi:hypothetical protein